MNTYGMTFTDVQLRVLIDSVTLKRDEAIDELLRLKRLVAEAPEKVVDYEYLRYTSDVQRKTCDELLDRFADLVSLSK